MIREAIVLAGGLGTRLQSVIFDLPKPMAPVNGKPFLEYVLNYLIKQQIEKVILSVGYKHEVIQNYFGERYKNLSVIYSIENDPLGTGGAIKKSCERASEDNLFILNGDTFFDIDLDWLYRFHLERTSLLTLALRPMFAFDRYGTVEIDPNNRIIGFHEKKWADSGMINGGVYVLDQRIFSYIQTAEKFSFEADIMEKSYRELNFYGFPFDRYFIDIGIPEDYYKASNELE